MKIIGALLAGLLFGLGLLLSGLADPDKVQAFLDLGGAWDPSLALVMLGAIAVAIVPFQLAKRNQIKPLSGMSLVLPKNTQLDRQLWLGAAIFGVGWGLVGYCPGPALVNFGAGAELAWWFVPAMVAGMAIKRRFF